MPSRRDGIDANASWRLTKNLSVARWRARPRLPDAARDTDAARSGLTPSEISASAICASSGRTKLTTTQRELIVARAGTSWSARRIKIIRSGGSSIVFNNRTAAESFMRCNSWIITILTLLSVGVVEDRRTMLSASSLSTAAPSRSTSTTSEYAPRAISFASRVVASSEPVMSSVENARAASSLLQPSGPTNK